LPTLPLFWNPHKKEYETLLSNPSFEVLLVSQFTLCAVYKGRKPDFHMAMAPKDAKVLYDQFLSMVRDKIGEERVKDGRFGAMMKVSVNNDGFTAEIDSRDIN